MKKTIIWLAFFVTSLGFVAQQKSKINCGLCNQQTIQKKDVPFIYPVKSDTTPVVDLLFIFDSSGLDKAMESASSIDSFARKAVSTMNTVMKNSKIDLRFRVAGTKEVAYTNRDIVEWLNKAYTDTEINNERRKTKADIIVLCSEQDMHSISGQANPMADRSLAIVSVRASAGDLNMMHEIGHVFGCEHSRTQSLQPGTHSYAVGTENNQFHTVMSYGKDNTQMAPIFSGIESVYNGVQLGSEKEDNVRMMRERAAQVAQYGEYLEENKYYLSDSLWQVPTEGGEQTFYLMTNNYDSYVITSNVAWIKVKTTKTYGDSKFMVEVSSNDEKAERKGTITIAQKQEEVYVKPKQKKYDGSNGTSKAKIAPVTITITQKAKETLTNVFEVEKEKAFVQVGKEVKVKADENTLIQILDLNGGVIQSKIASFKESSLYVQKAGVFILSFVKEGKSKNFKIKVQ